MSVEEEEQLEPGLEGFSDSDSDHVEVPIPALPEGMRKVTIGDPAVLSKRPQAGDDVVVRCVATRVSDGSRFALSQDGGDNDVLRFTLGGGKVARAVDVATTTMRRGEVASFTIASGAVRDDCSFPGVALPDGAVVLELEFLDSVSVCDLFDDGAVIKRVLRRGEDRRRPVMGLECRLGCSLALADGTLPGPTTLDYVVGGSTSSVARRNLSAKVLDAAVLSMRRGERVGLRLNAGIAFEGNGAAEHLYGLTPDAVLQCELELHDYIEVSDISFEGDKTVLKRSLHSRDTWENCQDAGTCSLKVHWAKQGNAVLAKDHFLQFVIGSGEVCDALECAAIAMRVHEVAEITCASAEMCLEPWLALQGFASVMFHLEVVDYEASPDSIASGFTRRGLVKGDTLLPAMAARKDRGCELFKAGRYRLGAHCFKMIFELLGYVDSAKGGAVQNAEIEDMKKVCMLNRALCMLRLGNFRAAALACDRVLEEEPFNAKALYRRAQARLGSEDCLLAMQDVRAAMRIEPQSVELRRLLKKVAVKQREVDALATPTCARMCSGLGRLPHPLDVD